MNSWQGGVVESCVVCMIARMYQFCVQGIDRVDWQCANSFGGPKAPQWGGLIQDDLETLRG